MPSQKLSLIISIIVISAVVLGIVIILLFGQGVNTNLKNQALNNADSIKFYPPLPKEIKRIAGEIEKIEGKTLFLKTKIKISPLPNEQYREETKKILVDNQTEIYQIDRLARIEPGQIGLPKTFLKFSDLKIGNQIAVQAELDIKDIEEFKAVEIERLF